MKPKYTYPSTIGFAVDLLVPADYPPPLGPRTNADLYRIIYLGDLLLLYDTLLIRSDAWTISFLYRLFTVDEMESLLKGGRLRFFAAMNDSSHATPMLGFDEGRPTQEYFSVLYDLISVWRDFEAKNIVGQIEAYSVEKQALNAQKAREFKQELQRSLRPDFYELHRSREEELYHWQGFVYGVGRILDIWSTGTLSMYIDPEMQRYLTFCDVKRSQLLRAVADELGNPVDELHTMHNIPTIADMVISGTLDKARMLELIQSDDAKRLRNWLRANITPGIDVRDSYLQTLGKLPSKAQWTSWGRFGVVSTLSTGLGFLLTGNPVLAALIGLWIGSTDTALGGKVTEKLFDPYHPKQWVSMIEKKVEKKGGRLARKKK